MAEKVILFSTPKGVFYIPLLLVAQNSADYYIVEKQGLDNQHQEYVYHVNDVMTDDFDGIDWLINSTNPEDWENDMVKYSDEILVTDEEYWTSSDDFKILVLPTK